MASHNTRPAMRAKLEKVTGMDGLTLFGLFAVTSMLVCYALEDRSRWFILAFAAACALGSIYGFLQGPGRSAWSRRSGPALRCGAGTSGSIAPHSLQTSRRATIYAAGNDACAHSPSP